MQDHFSTKNMRIKESGEKLAGLTFVITGDVHHFKNRDELKEEIEKNYKSNGNFIKYHYNRFVKRGKNNANH